MIGLGIKIGALSAAVAAIYGSTPAYAVNSLYAIANGVNGATNNAVVDGSSTPKTLTRFGNATTGDFSPFSISGFSGYFNGSSFLRSNLAAGLSLGTSAFTMDAWIFQTARSNNAMTVCTTGLFMYVLTTGEVKIATSSNSVGTTVAKIPLNTWTHVAVSYEGSGNTLRVFINGVLSLTTTQPWNVGGAQGLVGGDGNTYFVGYVASARIIKGIALYTSSFTPDTSIVLPTAETQLLTLQDNRFIDASANALVLTPNGAPSIQPLSPRQAIGYVDTINGGSLYFDGTGDYVTIAENAALHINTSDFTLECWIYKTEITSNRAVFSIGGPTSATGFGLAFYSSPFDKIGLITAGSGTAVLKDTTTFPLRQWTHVALVRNSGTLTLYVNGVSKGSVTWNGTWNLNGSTGYIGRWADGTSFDNTGHVSALRLVVGTALYSSNFAVPTVPPTAIANTQLLVNATNAGIADSSGKLTFETIGGTSVSTTTKKYNSSIYFNGTNSELVSKSSPITVLGTGDFTVEFWLNKINVGNSHILSIGNDWNLAGGLSILEYNGNYAFSVGGGYNSIAAPIIRNTWVHIAIVRVNGTSAKLYVDGVDSAAITIAASANLTLDFLRLGKGVTYGYSQMNIEKLIITKGSCKYLANFTPE